jgi:spore germination protein GerM
MKTFFRTTAFRLVIVGWFGLYMKRFNTERAQYVSNFLVQQEQVAIQEPTIGSYSIEQKLDSIIALLSWDKPSQPETNRPKATEPTTIQLYYFNELEDSKLPIEQQINTNSILPVNRTIRSSSNLIADAIKILLQGNLSEPEKDAWFITEFPNSNFKLLDSKLESNWTLTLTFSQVPGFTTGGSARMLILSKSIEKTALQFPQVQKVILEPDTLFQP